MNQLKQLEGNKVLTEFMGYKLARCNRGLAWESPHTKACDDFLGIHGKLFYCPKNQYYVSGNSYLIFHKSWNWLIPAVKRIKSFGKMNKKLSIQFSSALDELDLDNIFEQSVKCIEWYNNFKSK
jgi:hypothetical protein